MKKNILLIFLSIFLLISCYKESYIPVKTKFSVQFKNGDQSVPVYMQIENQTEGADSYQWTFEGGTPSTSDKKNPGEILYTQPGTYTIKLTASNVDGEKETYEQKIVIKDAVNISFTKEILVSDYPPVEVKFTNTTEGQGLTYNWTFDGGNPAYFEGKTPSNIIFSTPGTHEVKLTVSNGYETLSKTDYVTVKEGVLADFDWQTANEDYDYQAPVKLYLNNLTKNALSYQWNISGGTPSSSTDQNPSIVFSQPGTYTIMLTASNGKTMQSVQKQVTILPDTGIYILKDVKFGVNFAHNNNNVGAFYSTKLRRSFTASEVDANIGNQIDIAFQGQSNSFTYNKFISPTSVANYGFSSIPNAVQTIFINSQEICNCGLNVTDAQFDSMTDDSLLKNLNIPNSTAGQQQFGNSLPRIVLFKTNDGRKGAIKVKQFVGGVLNQSYILCDIKVQK